MAFRRSDAVCSCWCSGGYPIYDGCGSSSDHNDFGCTGISGMWSSPKCGKDELDVERKNVLCDRISSESNGAGSHRLRSSGSRTSMRKDRIIGSGDGDCDHCADRSVRNGSYISKIADERVKICYVGQ